VAAAVRLSATSTAESGTVVTPCVFQVPLTVSNLDFWSRYYFRCRQLDEEEARRVELMRRADEVQGDKEVGGWDEGLCLCSIVLTLTALFICLQCFDAVGWAAGRASGL